jgi:hypothetical protein
VLVTKYYKQSYYSICSVVFALLGTSPTRFTCANFPICTFGWLVNKVCIRSSSLVGKAIFREALEQGSVECYFPLAEQFTTQLEPSTCGPTSLVMILSSLGVDLMKKWKGDWRWYTEENLNLMTKDILSKGLHLESWTHIAKHNHLDVTTFNYPDQKIT